MILTKALAISVVVALAWAGVASWRVIVLTDERDELRDRIRAHEAAGQAWEEIYREQERGAQNAINETTQWWQAEKARADRLARERSTRLRDAPSGPPANGDVPDGLDTGGALEACHERLRDSGDETRGAIAAFEELTAAVRSAAVDDEARRRALASAPCVQPKP